MRFALKMTKESRYPTYRMACVALKGGRPIGYGINRPSPGILKNKRYRLLSLHCELDAVLAVGDNIKGATLYVAGTTGVGKLVKSKPCSNCQQTLEEAGIKAVFYHEPDGRITKWNLKRDRKQ